MGLHDPDLKAANTREEPTRVTPRRLVLPGPATDHLTVALPAASWNVLRLMPDRGRHV